MTVTVHVLVLPSIVKVTTNLLLKQIVVVTKFVILTNSFLQ